MVDALVAVPRGAGTAVVEATGAFTFAASGVLVSTFTGATLFFCCFTISGFGSSFLLNRDLMLLSSVVATGGGLAAILGSDFKKLKIP